jgi:peroxiredoxin
MLEPGTPVPHVQVWASPREEARPLRDVLGEGRTLLCFYPYDWSPTCTNELHLLWQRSEDLAAAGIRPFGISRDSPWSHRAWAQTLGVEIPLLSDWNGDAVRSFDVGFDSLGMSDVAIRSAFLIRDGETIEAAWLLGGELPDIDAVIEASRAV